MRRNAFTLIELLVVIAIIAILAAILFPVFAQAKESAKKTTFISNVKQNALSTILYTADNDDNFGSAYRIQVTGTIRTWPIYAAALFPATDDSPTGNWANATGSTGHQLIWHNATHIYRKNDPLLEMNGAPTDTISPYPANPIRPPSTSSLSFNGLLHFWSSTAIENPSSVPMVWPGLGKRNVKGLAHANPQLNCGSTTPQQNCRYGSAVNGGVLVRFGDGSPFVPNSHWAYSGGTVIARTDTSAKFYKIGAGTSTQPNNNPYGDPWSRYDETKNNGSPLGNYYNCPVGSVTYPCFFQPDRPQ